MGSLSGQRVVVVGGSSGMGLGCVEAAAAQGAEVIMVSRNQEKLDAAVAGVSGNVASVAVNIKDEEQVEQFFSNLGSVDHLVITASSTAMAPFVKMESGVAKNFFDTKFWGAFYCAKYAAPLLAKTGSITFVSGVASRRPMKGLSVAGACNGALESLAKSLALELAPIRVNTVSPGLVDTPLYAKMPEEQRKGMYEATAKMLPAGRVGTSSDIGEFILSVMTNAYITGTTLDIDGGNMVA